MQCLMDQIAKLERHQRSAHMLIDDADGVVLAAILHTLRSHGELLSSSERLRSQVEQMREQNEKLVTALKAWEHWYSVDSSEFNRDTAREMGLAALPERAP
jgi:hypothetical protein